MTGAAVVASGLVKRFGRAIAIDRVAFTMPCGQLWGVLAPRGGGRTTLIRLLAGLLRPNAGSVHVLGIDTADAAQSLQAMIGYVPQSAGSYDDLTVRENIRLHADLRGVPNATWPARLSEVLALTSLDNVVGEKAAALSPGLRGRLAVACALIAKPRLLLLDDLTQGLDSGARYAMLGLLRGLVEEKTSVFLTTSYVDEAEQCDSVIFLNDGRLVGLGPPHELVSSVVGRTRMVDIVPSDRHVAANAVRGMTGVVDVEVRRANLKILTDRTDRVLRCQQLGAPPDRIIPPRLDDALMSVLCDHGATTLAPLSVRLKDYRQPFSGPPALEVLGLGKRRHGRFLLKSLDLTVARGEIVGLMGANGAGKSLTLRLLCGLATPAQGAIRIGGIDLIQDRSAALGCLAHVSSIESPYPDLTPRQTLRFFASAHRLSRAQRCRRIDQLLAEFGLDTATETRSGSLSIGLQWRLALAAALVHEPHLLLLDEPSRDRDPLIHRLVWSDIAGLAAAGIGLLVGSRFAEDAERCDRIVLLEAGRVMAVAPPDEVIAARSPAA